MAYRQPLLNRGRHFQISAKCVGELHVAGCAAFGFEHQGLSELEVASDFRRADELELTSRNARQYQQADWAKRRKTTIAEEDVLSFLSRKAVIPKYGFPVDVVELDTQRAGTQQGFDVTLARDLTIAIGEFAPTATLVAGKRE